MENPFEIIIEKLTNIENRIARIEEQVCLKKIDKKRKATMMTDDEIDEYLFRTVFNIKR
jgi:hypothetical protein